MAVYNGVVKGVTMFFSMTIASRSISWDRDKRHVFFVPWYSSVVYSHCHSIIFQLTVLIAIELGLSHHRRFSECDVIECNRGNWMD